MRYFVLSAQLALVLWIIRWYSLQGRVFNKLAVLVWAGFTVSYFLPERARLPFFGLLSAGGILVIFGPTQGFWLLGLGLALIALCHLPIRFSARLAILLAAAILLTFLRQGSVAVPWSRAIWPIFGSMFALRILIYLYDLKHGNAPFSFWRSVSYFFMLPNAVFLLFPVADYQTLWRTYDDDQDRTRGFQKGIDWMVRGTVHLVLYRLVYQNLPNDAASVADVPGLLRYLIWPFLLYLNVSGLFHLAVGMLHLFGFNLPETHHLFYLASSFTDFWRRINIYWKDFMMKVFYYPAFFQLRRFGKNKALVLGTFVVFFATWVLHSWQWFWLRGSFLFKPSDILFWTILAVLVAGTVVLEANRPMVRKLATGAEPWGATVKRAFQALGVFLSICLLWSLWVSDSVRGWLSMFSVLGKAEAQDLRLLPVVLALAAAFLLVAIYYNRRKEKPFSFFRHAVRSGAILVALVLLGSYRMKSVLAEDAFVVLHRLRSSGLNSRDAARRQRGYYEQLNDVGWENAELAKLYEERPPDWGPMRYRPELVTLNAGLPKMELRPNAGGRHAGVQVQFNRWGMRDRDYPREPEAGTYRIALMGASHTFATGVPQELSYESLIEDRLNREGGLGAYDRVEILNFATEAYTPLDILAVVDRKVFGFKPNALLHVIHQSDAEGVVGSLSRLVENRAPIPYEELAAFAREANLPPGEDDLVARRALKPRREELLLWAYRQIVDRCRRHGIVAIAAYLPLMTPHDYDLPAGNLLAINRKSGYLLLDLSGVYAGQQTKTLQIARWDDHPNIAGHQLIAQRLYAALRDVETSLWRENDERRDQGKRAVVRSEGVSPGGGP